MEHSFSPEQLRRVLGSAEGRQLLALLNASRARWRRGVIETADYEGISGED